MFHASQVMKQQILDMERELTKSVKDQEENLATIEDTKSKLASSSSELLAGRRRVGQLQTSFGRCILSLSLLSHFDSKFLSLLFADCSKNWRPCSQCWVTSSS